MNIKSYSFKLDGNKNITENFKVKEMRSKDGADKIQIDYVIVCLAQYVRNLFNKSMIITSAYRTRSHNKAVGGASNSKHLLSCALDLKISGVSPQLLGDIFYSLGLVRIGVYSTFVHVDTDTSPIWLSKGNFTKQNVPFPNKLIKNKDNNYLVTVIQWKLKKLGFDCGREDGIFGNKTLIAVKNFQTSKKLESDGIVGLKTWNAMFNS